jgi:dipeptidyl aminopeptidase/acylaminoacyl peptidase/MFS family permease
MRTVLIASCVGSIIEWYDFFIFGSLAAILARQFYPPDNPTLSFLETLATFAVGFAVRPIGALFFGRIGDRLGRKKAFLTTLVVMGVSTCGIGLLPGYATIGVAAPLVLIGLRLVQGLALGGEYGGAAVYVAEHAPVNRRGYYTSYIYTTATVALLVSLLVIMASRRLTGEAAFEAWGWRIPFLVSAVLVVVSYVIRRRLEESPLFEKLRTSGTTSKAPIRDSFSGSRWKLMLILLFGVVSGHAVTWYTGQFYALFFLQTVLHLPMEAAYSAVTIALVLGTPCFVLFGALSDKVGRKPIIMLAFLLAAVTLIPVYRLMAQAAAGEPNVPALAALIFYQVVLAAMCTGPLGALLVDSFPTSVRYTGVSFVHHMGTGWFGGFLPLIATALVSRTGSPYAGLWYPIAVTAMAFVVGVLLFRECQLSLAGAPHTTGEAGMSARAAAVAKATSLLTIAFLALLVPAVAQAQDARGLRSADIAALRGLRDVQISPAGDRIAYSVVRSDRPGRASSETWILDLKSGSTSRLAAENSGASNPRWSPDGRWIAFFGREGDSSGVMIARADGSAPRFLARVSGTNAVLPSTGERLAWSPDGKRIAFVSSAPGPEEDANGDPMVITRYAYKPTASEGRTRFNDNRRVHIYVVDLAARLVKQVTSGIRYEHSIDWSPSGDEIVFVSNPERDHDRDFNYDIFAVNVESGAVRTVIGTRSVEYQPVWSPDGSMIAYLGTKRELTSSETTMEDTHVWVSNSDGSARRELGAAIDNRQSAPRWSSDGKSLYTTVRERGMTKLYRMPVNGSRPEVVVGDTGAVGSWSVASNGAVAYSFSSPTEPASLMLKGRVGGSTRTLAALNGELLGSRTIAKVQPFTFTSSDGLSVEAFLTMPLGRTSSSRHPLIVDIHGGPHGQQGPSFNNKAQVYAAHGYAVLMVNYRGSTGYGQRFTDAIFGDQDGREAEDVLAAVDTALARWPWLDSTRLGIEGGSYGGQLTNWIITRTDRFRAAIPIAGIANLVSFNYMSYYHDYLAVEFGRYPHEQALMDTLWARSPLRYVARVKTPTMLVHGENDNDVPIAEAEQFYIALKDVGVPTIMVRYPREGHGVRETGHVIDLMNRSMDWYGRWFGDGTRVQ